jgi:hypothetical protein
MELEQARELSSRLSDPVLSIFRVPSREAAAHALAADARLERLLVERLHDLRGSTAAATGTPCPPLPPLDDVLASCAADAAVGVRLRVGDEAFRRLVRDEARLPAFLGLVLFQRCVEGRVAREGTMALLAAAVRDPSGPLLPQITRRGGGDGDDGAGAAAAAGGVFLRLEPYRPHRPQVVLLLPTSPRAAAAAPAPSSPSSKPAPAPAPPPPGPSASFSFFASPPTSPEEAAIRRRADRLRQAARARCLAPAVSICLVDYVRCVGSWGATAPTTPPASITRDRRMAVLLAPSPHPAAVLGVLDWEDQGFGLAIPSAAAASSTSSAPSYTNYTNVTLLAALGRSLAAIGFLGGGAGAGLELSRGPIVDASASASASASSSLPARHPVFPADLAPLLESLVERHPDLAHVRAPPVLKGRYVRAVTANLFAAAGGLCAASVTLADVLGGGVGGDGPARRGGGRAPASTPTPSPSPVVDGLFAAATNAIADLPLFSQELVEVLTNGFAAAAALTEVEGARPSASSSSTAAAAAAAATTSVSRALSRHATLSHLTDLPPLSPRDGAAAERGGARGGMVGGHGGRGVSVGSSAPTPSSPSGGARRRMSLFGVDVLAALGLGGGAAAAGATTTTTTTSQAPGAPAPPVPTPKPAPPAAARARRLLADAYARAVLAYPDPDPAADDDAVASLPALRAHLRLPLSLFALERVGLAGRARPLASARPGLMAFDDCAHLWAACADRFGPRSCEYWVRVLDLDDDGQVSAADAAGVYEGKLWQLRRAGLGGAGGGGGGGGLGGLLTTSEVLAQVAHLVPRERGRAGSEPVAVAGRRWTADGDGGGGGGRRASESDRASRGAQWHGITALDVRRSRTGPILFDLLVAVPREAQ